MKSLSILLIFFITLSLNATNFLNSSYNSIDVNFGIIRDNGLEVSEIGYEFNYKPKGLNLIYGYDFARYSCDKLGGLDVSLANLRTEINSFGFGFLFSQNDLDIVPSIKFGTGNFEALDLNIVDLDHVEASIMLRILYSENVIVSFTASHITFGNPVISNSKIDMINYKLNSDRYENIRNADSNTLGTALNSIESLFFDDISRLSVALERRFDDLLSVKLSFSMDNFHDQAENPNVSLTFGYNY